jgi:hypothetical protein
VEKMKVEWGELHAQLGDAGVGVESDAEIVERGKSCEMVSGEALGVDEWVREERVRKNVAQVLPECRGWTIEGCPDGVKQASSVSGELRWGPGPRGTTASEERAAVIEEGSWMKRGEWNDATGGRGVGCEWGLVFGFGWDLGKRKT